MTGAWLISATAGLACSWIVCPPYSKAGKAAWAALAIGFVAAAALLTIDHRAVLVIALPIVVLSAPLAVIRRHRASAELQEGRAARRRINVAVLGTLLYLLGVNVAVLNAQATWAGPVLWIGALLTAGVLPFHRPGTETLRAASAEIRTPVALLLGPAVWMSLAAWSPPQVSTGGAVALPLLTLWLGAFLVLARGDIPRFSAALFLFATGQVAMAASFDAASALHVTSALTPPLLLATLLLAKLERLADTRDFSELGGLARRLPRFSLALLAAGFWLVGTAALPQVRTLIQLKLSSRALTSTWSTLLEIWPVFVPHVLAVWGWSLLMRDLLVGPARLPLFPEILRDRVEMPPAEKPLEDLTLREVAAIVAFAVIAVAT